MIELLIAIKLPLIILQLILAPVLVLLVLLQSGKGDDLGSAFGAGGGGSGSVLGAGGASKFLVRGTVIFVVLFMVNSIVLAKVFKATAEHSEGLSVQEPMVPPPVAGNALGSNSLGSSPAPAAPVTAAPAPAAPSASPAKKK